MTPLDIAAWQCLNHKLQDPHTITQLCVRRLSPSLSIMTSSHWTAIASLSFLVYNIWQGRTVLQCHDMWQYGATAPLTRVSGTEAAAASRDLRVASECRAPATAAGAPTSGLETHLLPATYHVIFRPIFKSCLCPLFSGRGLSWLLQRSFIFTSDAPHIWRGTDTR